MSRISLPMTVLSPPGITNPSMGRSRSALLRISKHSAPKSERTSSCSLKAPWSARTPIALIGRAPPS